MQLKNYFIIPLLLITAIGYAGEGGIISNANKNNVTYIKNIKRTPDIAYQQELRQRASWQNFLAANNTWYVKFNEENAKPHRAYGTPIPVFGANATAKALNFITTKLSGFNIPVNELEYTSGGTSPNFQYVHFIQKHNNLKVLHSDLFVKLTLAGEVITFGCDVFNDINISSTAAISETAAITFAQAGLSETVLNTSVKNELFILPIPEFKQNIYKLVYEVTIETKDEVGIPARYYTLVDANTGAVLYRENKILHYKKPQAAQANTDINITGTVFEFNPYTPSVVKPLRNLKMTESGTNYNTDSLGFVGLSNSTPTAVSFSLEGLWSHVYTNNVTPTYTATANPGANTYSFDANANIRELSAYYHVNIVHDYMKTKFPNFTDMDNPLTTNVDLTSGTCNAFYDGSSINFYALAGGCNSLAQVGDVVYHEYGHGINDKFYNSQGGNFGNGSLGEGYADIWALGITNNPILGTGFDEVDPTVVVRRYDIDKKVYPQDLNGEVHANGEIIAGCWWDTNLNFGNLQQMVDLFKETFYATLTAPDGDEGNLFTDVLVEALTDDDAIANGGDNNITNGTPNDVAIIDGFALHGITLLSNATLIHTPIISAVNDNDIIINANVTVTYAWALGNAKVFYKINRLGAWNSAPLNSIGGGNYTVTIPGQPTGSVIGYYLALEGTTGLLSAVQPIAAEAANPNIPHFILVNADLTLQEDFDATFGAWGAGISSDLATTGIWDVAVPVGSFSTPGDASTLVQPDYQNTPGGTMCAFTGNAQSESDALGTNDVDGGSTTLESPVYNLNSYINPILTYDRWYINNPPSGANPGNDYWETQISNDGSTWVKVERTNVSDKSWRRFAFRVKDYVSLSNTIQMRFIASDSLIAGANLNGGSIVEAAIDNYYLYEAIPSGIHDIQNIIAVNVFPNPAKNMVTINYDLVNSQDVTIEMVNNMGQIVYQQLVKRSGVGSQSIMIETSRYAAGIYQLNIKTNGQTNVKKLAIMK